MNPDPDYSAPYVIARTDAGDGLEGHGFTFTIGRGTEVVVAAVRALEPLVVGREVEALEGDLGGVWRGLVGHSQLLWIGPEKGVLHLATAAVVNAVWDLLAKRAGKPLWKLLADLEPEELVACLDLRYVEDALPADEAVELLRAGRAARAERETELARDGIPAYTTSAGWLGYGDEKVVSLARAAVADGFTALKMKVGGNPADDLRRARLLRRALGGDRLLMMDANQVWGVDEAIAAMEPLRELDPWWIEEPTSPDDVLGHARI